MKQPNHFPLQNNCGGLNAPVHIRAFSPELDETFTKISQYRHMSLEQQVLELQYMKRVCTAEMKFYERRLDALASQQQVHIDDWNQAQSHP